MAILWADQNGFHTIKPWMSVPESVDFFPSRQDICQKIIYSGFHRAELHDLTFGVSTIFLGYKDE